MEKDPEVQAVLDEFTKAPRRVKDVCMIDTNSRNYWKKVFDTMDQYSKIPYHKRLSILENTLKDDDILIRLRKIYDVHKHPDIVEYGTGSQSDLFETVKDEVSKCVFFDYEYNEGGITSSLELLPARVSSTLPELPATCQINLNGVLVDYRLELTKTPEEAITGQSMYMNFLKKSESNANRWSPKPPETLEGMSLQGKCDASIKEITSDFVNWMNNLGGVSKSTLDEAGIEALFEIGFNCHATDSLAVHVQELNAVSEYVAKARNQPEVAFSTQLYRQLYRDMSAVKSKAANYAFGTMLPPDMRKGIPRDSTVSKWLENKRVPEQLSTMAVVWEGIESLKSTEGYCNWLLDHEGIAPPNYLVGKGMLKDKKNASLETRKSGDGSLSANDKSNSRDRHSNAFS